MKYILTLALISLSCRDNSLVDGGPVVRSVGGAYIINEGGFSGGGALSYYDRDRDTIYNALLGPAQGWIFPNDIKAIGGKAYVAVNGLDRIDVVSDTSNQFLHSIVYPHSTGPGFLAAAGSATLFSANYNGTVSAIDLSRDSLAWTSDPAVSFPGGIAVAGDRIFLSDIGLYPNAGLSVKVLSAASGMVVDSIRTVNAPGPMAVMNGSLYVVCTGTSKVYRINPVSLLVQDSVQLQGYFSDMAADVMGSLYVMSGDSVAKISASPMRFEGSVARRTSGLYFYSIGVDTLSGEIYLSNVVSSGGSGELDIFSPGGTLRRPPLGVGIFPGAFAFKGVK